jgi:DNA topoisomerase-1
METTDEDVPLAKAPKKKAVVKKAAASPKKPAKAKKETKAQVKKEAKPVKKEKADKSPGRKKAKSEAEEEQAKQDEDEEKEEEYKWWLEENRDETIKWTTLEHNGVLFPPVYEPHGIKMRYDGNDLSLSPEGEEVATFYAACLGTDWVENPTFRKNFFVDFLAVLKDSDPGCPVKEFDKCDFSPILQHLEAEKERKKSLTKEEKAKLKEEKAKVEEKYGYALLDGRKEKVGNFRIEPPGLFRGRGEHPKTGSLKVRFTIYLLYRQIKRKLKMMKETRHS